MVHASRGGLTPASPTPAAARSRSSRGLAQRGARPDVGTVDWAGFAQDYDRDPRPHRARDPGLRGLQRARPASPAASRCRTPPRRRAASPTADRQGAASRVNPLAALERAAGPPAAADGAQPRPVQHHDLRPRRPLPRHQAAAAASSSSTPTDLPRLGFADGDVRRPRQRVRRDDGERRAEGFRVVPYPTAPRLRGGLLSRRPTSWSRSTTADTSNTPAAKSLVVRFERP